MDRQRQGQTQRQTQRHRDRATGTERDGDRDRETGTDRDGDGDRDRQTDRQTDRQVEKESGGGCMGSIERGVFKTNSPMCSNAAVRADVSVSPSYQFLSPFYDRCLSSGTSVSIILKQHPFV